MSGNIDGGVDGNSAQAAEARQSGSPFEDLRMELGFGRALGLFWRHRNRHGMACQFPTTRSMAHTQRAIKSVRFCLEHCGNPVYLR